LLSRFQVNSAGRAQLSRPTLSKASEVLGITIQPSAGGDGGTFIPQGIRSIGERSSGWMSRYHR
jgi:hypothetical protein